MVRHSGWGEEGMCRIYMDIYIYRIHIERGGLRSNEGELECYVSASTGDQGYIFGKRWLQLGWKPVAIKWNNDCPWRRGTRPSEYPSFVRGKIRKLISW